MRRRSVFLVRILCSTTVLCQRIVFAMNASEKDVIFNVKYHLWGCLHLACFKSTSIKQWLSWIAHVKRKVSLIWTQLVFGCSTEFVRSIVSARFRAVSSNTGYFITQPIRIEYFKHVTELIHSRPISVQDFMGASTTCKTTTKSLPTFLRHVRHTKSHVSTNFILTSHLALQSGRVSPPIDVTPISF